MQCSRHVEGTLFASTLSGAQKSEPKRKYTNKYRKFKLDFNVLAIKYKTKDV